MRQYQIVGNDGKPKHTWGEINCDYIEISGTVVKFFTVDENKVDEWSDGSTLMIAYNLAPGEALIFVGEE